MSPTTASLVTRWAQLRRLRDRLDVEIKAVRNGLLVAGIDPDTGGPLVPPTPITGRQPFPSKFTYTDREARAAHALHAAGETSDWVRDGERAYQRTKKRAERARKDVA